MWLKLLLCALLVAFCTFLGYLYAGKYRNRRSFFSQLAALNENYLTELRYSRKPLPVFLSESKPCGDIRKLAESVLEGKAPSCKCAYLTEEERESANRYFSALGRGDSLSQQRYFEGKRAEIAEKQRESETDAVKKGALCVKLGFLLGLALVILIV